MADIFSNAERVVVWLGPESNDSTMAMTLMESLSSKFEVDWNLQKMRPSSPQSEAHWSNKDIILTYEEDEWHP
jgi:hypothetical protein